ncbi:hypothetical protein D3C78_598360 [compost metagenome]
MADISFDVAEGYYLSTFTARMILSGNVQSLQFSVNGAPPSISKYVAYDQLVPPNPFIAVTQDGTGNVVYDGGFPKFYNSNAPIQGINASISMEFRATCTGQVGTENLYYYNAFSDLPVTIAIGDKLVYDMAQNSASARVSIDAVTANSPAEFPGQYSLRDWGYPTVGVIKDQNNLRSHPATDLGGRAVNQWYHREFDLSPCAGHTFIRWSMAYEQEVAGDYYTRFRDVYILDRNGNIKATLFKDSIKLPNSSSAEAGASGYTNLVKSLYDPRSQLTASFKYLYNAILWTANPKKVTAGNRNILILGDAVAAGNYAVKSTAASGFNTSFTRLCAAVGFTPTFKDTSDYVGGALGCTAAELDQYACVLLMSSIYSTNASITDACVQNLVAYREAGNGLIVVTDHGAVLSNISQAYPLALPAFFATANKLVVQFGAYFSGDYNRTPVNVGFLRSTYGDHPLYAGMTNDESISAGGSESRVQVATFTPVAPGAVAPFNIPLGKTIIRVAAVLNSGEIVPYKIEYNVVSFKITFSDGVQVKDNGQILDVGVKNQSLIQTAINGTLAENAAGLVYKNGARVGTFSYTQAGGSVQTWDGAGNGPVKVQNNDTFSVTLTSPVAMTSQVKIQRFQPPIKAKRDLSDIMKILRAYKPTLTDIKRVGTVISEIAQGVPWLGLKQSLNMPINLKLIGEYFNNEGLASLVLPNAATKPYIAASRPWAASGVFAMWAPTNPVTAAPVDFKNFAYSPVHGSELVPANFKLDYYANIYLPAGNYRMFSQADDIFEFFVDGALMISKSAQGTTDITIPESRFYALKVSNTNTPANTPSWWTCALVNLATGAVVLTPEPGVWKTQEYSAS